MDELKINFDVLMGILLKKESLLQQILTLTENQYTVLLCGEEIPEAAGMFSEMNAEKQRLIDEVINADNVFQSTFEAMSDDFSRHADNYTNEVTGLQEAIKEVVGIDVKIRVAEQKNKDLIGRKRPKSKMNVIKMSKNNLLQKYESNNKPKNN